MHLYIDCVVYSCFESLPGQQRLVIENSEGFVVHHG